MTLMVGVVDLRHQLIQRCSSCHGILEALVAVHQAHLVFPGQPADLGGVLVKRVIGVIPFGSSIRCGCQQDDLDTLFLAVVIISVQALAFPTLCLGH